MSSPGLHGKFATRGWNGHRLRFLTSYSIPLSLPLILIILWSLIAPYRFFHIVFVQPCWLPLF